MMWNIYECSCTWFVFFFKQKTAYEMRISDWSSDVCSSDLRGAAEQHGEAVHLQQDGEGDQHQRRHEDTCLQQAHLAGGNRPRGGAGDAPVDVATEDVVARAAARAPEDGADAEEIVRAAGRNRECPSV